MLDKINCVECHSLRILPDNAGGYVCADCGVIQPELDYGNEFISNSQRTAVIHSGDIGSIIYFPDILQMDTRISRLLYLQKKMLTSVGRSALQAFHLFANFQDYFHIPLTSNQFMQLFYRYYPQMTPRSKVRNVCLFTSGLYISLAKQIQVPLNLRELAIITQSKISDLFRILTILEPILKKDNNIAISKDKSEDKLLYGTFERLRVPLELYSEAQALLSNSDHSLGNKKRVRICSAIIHVLKKHDLLKQHQYRVYHIANQMHISASILYRYLNEGK